MKTPESKSDKDYKFLEEYDAIKIERCENNVKQYRLLMYIKDNVIKEILCDVKQRERLEVYLIGKKDVIFCDEREDEFLKIALRSFTYKCHIGEKNCE